MTTASSTNESNDRHSTRAVLGAMSDTEPLASEVGASLRRLLDALGPQESEADKASAELLERLADGLDPTP